MHRLRRAFVVCTCDKDMWYAFQVILKTLSEIAADEILFIFILFIYLFFRGNKAWHVMWLVCLADESRDRPSLIVSVKSSAAVVISNSLDTKLLISMHFYVFTVKQLPKLYYNCCYDDEYHCLPNKTNMNVCFLSFILHKNRHTRKSIG